MVGPRAEAMISKALSVDELWRPGVGGLLQLTLLFPLFALIIFCRTACLLVSYIPWPLTS